MRMAKKTLLLDRLVGVRKRSRVIWKTRRWPHFGPRVELFQWVIRDVGPTQPNPMGLSLEAPVSGPCRTASLYVSGSIAARDEVHQISLVDGPRVLRRAPLDMVLEGRRAFRLSIGPLDAAKSFTLGLAVGTSDRSQTQVGHIRGTRTRLFRPAHAHFHPVFIGALGRSGSTWAMHLCAQHPELAVYRPFAFDARVATYWADVLRVLGAPRSSAKQLVPEGMPREGWWAALDASAADEDRILETIVREEVTHQHLADLAAFAVRRIDSVYRQVAGQTNKPSARRFVEKIDPIGSTLLTHE